MEKTIFVYESSRGNTETLAGELKGTFEKYNRGVRRTEVTALQSTGLPGDENDINKMGVGCL